jgi:hypothetical protein
MKRLARFWGTGYSISKLGYDSGLCWRFASLPSHSRLRAAGATAKRQWDMERHVRWNVSRRRWDCWHRRQSNFRRPAMCLKAECCWHYRLYWPKVCCAIALLGFSLRSVAGKGIIRSVCQGVFACRASARLAGRKQGRTAEMRVNINITRFAGAAMRALVPAAVALVALIGCEAPRRERPLRRGDLAAGGRSCAVALRQGS